MKIEYDEKKVQVSGPPKEPTPIKSAVEKVASDLIVPPKSDVTPTTTQLEREIRAGHITFALTSGVSDRTVFLSRIIALGIGSDESCVMEAPDFEPTPLRLWQDADERNRLLEITDKILADQKYIGSNFSNEAALKVFNGQRDVVEQHATDGKLADAPFVKSLQAIQDDFRARRLAAEKVWVALTQESAPLMRKAIDRAVSILHGALVYLEFIGREEAASFGMTWQPSPLWKAIAHTLVKFSLKKDPAPGVWVLPSHHLDGLLEIDL
jgi:hypothetical protein